ncbi:hypothetical protein [Proteus mirabilis]|uniref:hypothetical protein n=1 Tax=Proteus mirabilis TaxID=584 RepID=UPI0034D53871
MLTQHYIKLGERNISVTDELDETTRNLNKSFKEFMIAIKVLDSEGEFLGESYRDAKVTLFPSVITQGGICSRFELSSLLDNAEQYDINLGEKLKTSIFDTISMYELNDDEFWFSFPEYVNFIPSLSNGITYCPNESESDLHFNIRKVLELKDVSIIEASMKFFKDFINFSKRTEELMLHYQRVDIRDKFFVLSPPDQRGFYLEPISHKNLFHRCYFWLGILEGDFVKENILCLDV